MPSHWRPITMRRQPAGRDAWQTAGRGKVRSLALDRRAAAPVRLLHGERRRRGAIVMVDAERCRRFRAKAGVPARSRLRVEPRFATHAPISPNPPRRNFGTVAEGSLRMAASARRRRRGPGVRELYRGRCRWRWPNTAFQPAGGERFSRAWRTWWPGGRLPALNTSGGNLAECYIHGFELVLEAVRQVRGTSTARRRERRGAGDQGTHGGAGQRPVAGLARCIWTPR